MKALVQWEINQAGHSVLNCFETARTLTRCCLVGKYFKTACPQDSLYSVTTLFF